MTPTIYEFVQIFEKVNVNLYIRQVSSDNNTIAMDIYPKVKYNKPKELAAVVNGAFGQ